MRPNLFAVAAFAVLLPFAAHAQPIVQSQEGIALENQILQLQQQVQQLQTNAGWREWRVSPGRRPADAAAIIGRAIRRWCA